MSLEDKEFEFGRKIVTLRIADRHFRKESGGIARARRLYVEDGQSARSLVVYGDAAHAWALDAYERSRRGAFFGMFASLERISALGILKDLEERVFAAALRPDTTAEHYERFAVWLRSMSQPHFPASETECREYWHKARDYAGCGIAAVMEGKTMSASTHPKLHLLAAEVRVDRRYEYPGEYGRYREHLEKAVDLVNRLPDAQEAAPLMKRIGDLYDRLGVQQKAADWRARAEDASGE